MGLGVDRHVAQFAKLIPVFQSEHASDRSVAGPHEQRFPSTDARADEALRQDDERDWLMVGDERKLVVPHAHLQGLTAVPVVDYRLFALGWKRGS